MAGFDINTEANKVKILDEGLSLTDNVNSIDFVGAGVTGSIIGSDVTETIPGGSYTDEKVSVDAGATPGYIGATDSDGVLRVDSTLDYADGGDFVTIGLESGLKGEYDDAYNHITEDGSSHTFIDQDVTTISSPTFVSPTVDSLQFDLTGGISCAEGQLAWDINAGTLELGMPGGNVCNQIGQELLLPRRVKNDSGVDIKNGNLVYISGGTGINSEITLADKGTYDTAMRTIAMATEDIDDGAFGYCTVIGLVNGEAGQPIDTSGGSAGDILYLGDAGAFTTTMPSAPDAVVEIGAIFRSNATTGAISVRIQKNELAVQRDIQKEPTGFTAPEDVIVTGDSSTRTVTLTGTVNSYYKGVPVPTIISGYTSPAHDNITTNVYFLLYDGTSVAWHEISTLDVNFYKELLIALTFYNGTTWVYQRECHAVMPWEIHKEFHKTVGTYKDSGGGIGDYVLDSTTVAERRPSVAQSLIYDEGLPTTNPALASEGNYTQYFLSGAGGTPNFNITATDIVPLSGDQPYFNEFTGGAWQQTLMTNNYHMSIWLIAAPMTADSDSQKLRYTWIQGQSQSALESTQRALTPNDVNLGGLTDLTPEIVFIGRVIIKYVGTNWEISFVESIDGTRFSQTTSPQGNYLSSVSSDATLTGSGTATDPLGVDTTLFVLADGTVPLTADWDAGSFKITAEQLESDVTTGTAPLIVASTTLVDNLNADLLDGQEASEFVEIAGDTMTGALVAADHGTATDAEVVGIVYGTGSPPVASTTPIGTLFVKYTA